MVVQENNFLEMRDSVFLGQRFGADTVYFSRLADWGTFSPEELQSRSVHRADHRRHQDLRGGGGRDLGGARRTSRRYRVGGVVSGLEPGSGRRPGPSCR